MCFFVSSLGGKFFHLNFTLGFSFDRWSKPRQPSAVALTFPPRRKAEPARQLKYNRIFHSEMKWSEIAFLSRRNCGSRSGICKLPVLFVFARADKKSDLKAAPWDLQLHKHQISTDVRRHGLGGFGFPLIRSRIIVYEWDHWSCLMCDHVKLISASLESVFVGWWLMNERLDVVNWGGRREGFSWQRLKSLKH